MCCFEIKPQSERSKGVFRECITRKYYIIHFFPFYTFAKLNINVYECEMYEYEIFHYHNFF